MKVILIILFLVSAISMNAQYKVNKSKVHQKINSIDTTKRFDGYLLSDVTSGNMLSGNGSNYETLTLTIKPDTIPMLLLVVDTTRMEEHERRVVNFQFGYMVDDHAWHYLGQPIVYLDENKNPFSKTTVIFEAIKR